jgi:hypothetical protein
MKPNTKTVAYVAGGRIPHGSASCTSRSCRKLEQLKPPTKHHHSSLSLSATEHAAEMHALLGSFIVGTMNGRNRHRVWAWLLCALLFWLTANPPHCDLCDGISFTVASAHQSIVKRSHPVAPDDCNGICSCCWFHGLPNGRQVLIPVNIELAGVAPEAPRPAFVLRSTIFRPPRTVVS